MNKREKFLASHVFTSFTERYKAEQQPDGTYTILKSVFIASIPGFQWMHHGNIQNMSQESFEAYSSIISKSVSAVINFKDLVFINQEGGNDVEL